MIVCTECLAAEDELVAAKILTPEHCARCGKTPPPGALPHDYLRCVTFHEPTGAEEPQNRPS